MYLASGIIFMPEFSSEKIYYWLKFNPPCKLAEWIRAAYYPAVGLKIDYLYVIMFALSCLSLGLFLVKHVSSKQS